MKRGMVNRDEGGENGERDGLAAFARAIPLLGPTKAAAPGGHTGVFLRELLLALTPL